MKRNIIAAILASLLFMVSFNASADQAVNVNLTISNNTTDTIIRAHEGYIWRSEQTLAPGESKTWTMFITGIITNIQLYYLDKKTDTFLPIPGCPGDSWQVSSTTISVKDADGAPYPRCKVAVH